MKKRVRYRNVLYYGKMNAEELVIARTKLGLTQKELADELGLSIKRGRITVNEWENQRYPVPDWVAKFVIDGIKHGLVPVDVDALAQAILANDASTVESVKEKSRGRWARIATAAVNRAYNLE